MRKVEIHIKVMAEHFFFESGMKEGKMDTDAVYKVTESS